jgi:3-methyladenine DNA glycosylase AlkD
MSKTADVAPAARALAEQLVAGLRAQRNEANIAGQQRFGITTKAERLGISAPVLRALGRQHRRNHGLALALWATAIQDARALATLVDDPGAVTPGQMERWVRDCDNWAITDAVAFLFDRTPFALAKVRAWSRRRAEFQKRAAFSIIAGMAVHRKELPDAAFLPLLALIERAAADDRNFVRKAVNWALRQIGKRNPRLRQAAIATALRLQRLDSRAARWIAADALRELRDPRVIARCERQGAPRRRKSASQCRTADTPRRPHAGRRTSSRL